MADFSNKEIAATLASGILAASAGALKVHRADEQAGIAIEVYSECLKQLRAIPAEPPRI